MEDRAVSRLHDQPDHRSRICAPRRRLLRAQELVVAGLGAVPRFFEIFARLDPRPPAQTRFEVVSHPEIFDGVRVRSGQVLAVIRHNARALLSCERVILNLHAASERHCHAHAANTPMQFRERTPAYSTRARPFPD